MTLLDLFRSDEWKALYNILAKKWALELKDLLDDGRCQQETDTAYIRGRVSMLVEILRIPLSEVRVQSEFLDNYVDKLKSSEKRVLEEVLNGTQ